MSVSKTEGSSKDIEPTLHGTPTVSIMPLDQLKIHPILTQFNSPMTPEERSALRADVRLRGIMAPIDINQRFEILDGIHRYDAAKDEGLIEIPVRVFTFSKEDDEHLHIYKSNMVRKTLSTQYKYLTISRISEVYEKGRGGKRTPGKAVSDTALRGDDVNAITGKALGVAPDVVKLARRYAREISKFPEFAEIEPTKFLKAVLPLTELKNKYFRDGMIDIALRSSAAVTEYGYERFKDFDRLLGRARTNEIAEQAANFILQHTENHKKGEMIDRQRLAYILHMQDLGVGPLSEMKSLHEVGSSSTAGGPPGSEGCKENYVKLDSESSVASNEASSFEQLIDRLYKKRISISKEIEIAKDIFDTIASDSLEDQVSIKRLLDYSQSLEDFYNWLPSCCKELEKLRGRFETEGYRPGPSEGDDTLKLYPSRKAKKESSQP